MLLAHISPSHSYPEPIGEHILLPFVPFLCQPNCFISPDNLTLNQ